MTNDQLNKRLAELLGWKPIVRRSGGLHPKEFRWWKAPNGMTYTEVPDYAGDLNAVHEVEKQIRPRVDEYVEIIREIILEDARDATGEERSMLFPMFATAKQRTEALIRTLEGQA